MGRERGTQVIPLCNAYFLAPLIVSFHVRKSYMSNTNFCNLSQNVWKRKKHVGPRLYIQSAGILHPA